MKKILITGNSGYIGSHLTKLLEDTYELYGLDTMNPRVDIKHFIRQHTVFISIILYFFNYMIGFFQFIYIDNL